MRLFGFDISRGAATETKQSATASAMVRDLNDAVWSKRDYRAFAQEGYQKNVVANRCISSIAEAIASVPLTYFQGDTELTNTPIKALLDNPNPSQTYSEYVEAKVGYLMISGNSYEEGVTASRNEVRELYNLRPDRMKIVPGSDGTASAYVYEVGGQKVKWDLDIAGGIIPVLHSKLFNPTDDWYGQAPIEAGAYAIDVHNECMAHIQALLQNSAKPSGALVTKEGQSLSDENYNRLKLQMEEQYQGAKNAGRPMLLEGGLDWKPMGLSPNDMQIIETKNSAARDICLAFGVPPMLIGIPGDNTYSNYSEARLAFWEDTVIPLLNRILGDWQGWLAEPMGVTIKPDLDQIPAIVEKREKLWAMLQDSKVLTVNEKREAMGYDAVKGGDEIFMPMGEVPMGSNTQQRLMEDVDSKTLADIAGYNKVVNLR